jgi:hypothetical protein
MTEILAFVLGVSAVAFVWVVVVAFKTASRVKEIEKSIQQLQDWISRNDDLTNRRIDQEIDRTNNLYTDSIRYTDSRVDKLEAKITNEQGSKQLIKG